VFIALDIYHAVRMRCIMLPFVACHTLQYFCTLSHKRHRFRTKNIEHEMYFSAKFLILRRIQ